MKKKQIYRRGLTLIELLVVIGVIGVIASAVIVLIEPWEQIAKARDARKKNDLAELRRGLELYYDDHGRYPLSPDFEIDGIGWGNPWPPYVDRIPQGHYRYVAAPDGSWYRLYAFLSRFRSDRDACYVNGAACDNVPPGGPGNGGAYNDPSLPGSTSRMTCAPCNPLTRNPDGSVKSVFCPSCNYGVSSPNTTL